ncbi:MAG TPA: hypothetical protein VJ201_07530 [Candidatus Babeliales bacterium]|nr:hypothetical protein [Candidatus Babeliales bacterium]
MNEPMSDQELMTISDRFSQTQNKSDISEILKELFDEDKIMLITDITDDEIKLITRIRTIAKIKGFTQWEECVLYYIKLKVSKDRKSRKEIIEAIKGMFGFMMPKKSFLGMGRREV